MTKQWHYSIPLTDLMLCGITNYIHPDPNHFVSSHVKHMSSHPLVIFRLASLLEESAKAQALQRSHTGEPHPFQLHPIQTSRSDKPKMCIKLIQHLTTFRITISQNINTSCIYTYIYIIYIYIYVYVRGYACVYII